MTSHPATIRSLRRPGESHYGGTVAVEKDVIVWEEGKGGEIAFSKNGSPALTFGELGLNDNQQLQLINKLLAHYRAHAVGDENHYYAAAAGITKEGHLFLETNNMVHIEDKFYRGCAETPLLRRCQGALGTDVELSKVFLMSGIAEKKPDGTLKEKEPCHIACPCGECRANLRAHTKGGLFIMVPTNDGTMTLTHNAQAQSAAELRGSQAWEISYDTMYPLPTHKPMQANTGATVEDGYRYITDTHAAPLPVITPFGELKAGEDGNVSLSVADFMKLRKAYEHQDFSLQALGDNPSLENINRAMLQLMKKAYEAHIEKISDKHNMEISVVVLKTSKGEFFPGVLVDGRMWLPSKPGEMPVALSNAFNQVGIAEVYMMTFDDQQIRGEISAWKSGATEGHHLKMPGPATLGRLLKNMKDTDQTMMKIIPVNNGTLSESQLSALMPEDIAIKEAFGPGYTNPKQTNRILH